MDPPAERREDAHPPVADLVAEALDDDGPVAREDAGRGLLLGEELEQVAGGQGVEVVVALEDGRVLVDGPAGERADRLAELLRPADRVALPERDRPGGAGRRGDDHAVAADLLDPPGARPEEERLPGPRLVDHLLVELADPAPVGEGDGEEAAVGDRPGVGHSELPGAPAGGDRPTEAIPVDPGPQLAELGRRVAAVEHVEDVLEELAAQVGVGVRPGDEGVELVDRDPVGAGRDGDDLLGEDVERVAGNDGRLDPPFAHHPGEHGALEQVGPELRVDAPLARGPDPVPGPADPLEPAGDRLGRLDLDHEVDRPHVDPELERGGRDQAGELPGLQELLDRRALLARERAVVRAGELRPRGSVGGAFGAVLAGRGELVEPKGQAFGRASTVDEDDRRAVLADEAQELRVHGRPDRPAGRLGPGETVERVGSVGQGVGLDHRLDGDMDAQVERAARADVDDPGPAVGADHEAGDLLEWVLGGREPDPLELARAELLEALEGEGEVGAALGRGDGVDLVEDHRLGRPEDLPGLGGQHQVERLGRGDEDVRGMAEHRRPLAGRGVAGPDRDADVGAHAPEGDAEVALDVVGERLHRGDVDEPGPVLGVGPGRRPVGDQAVESPEEGGERLARAGRRADQDVLAGGDRRPGLGLGGGRGLEGAVEPVANERDERRQGHGPRR